MNQGLWYCGNIVVATFLCLNISCLSAAGAPINISGLESDKIASGTQIDVSFGKTLVINNRTVKCSGKIQGSHYPSPMYTCQNISVNDKKLYHGAGGGRSQCSSGCPCGRVEGPPNDIHALCSEMLRANGVNEQLLAAYVVKPSCVSDGELSRRVKFYLNEDGSSVWEDIVAPNGFINMLQCLTTKHIPVR